MVYLACYVWERPWRLKQSPKKEDRERLEIWKKANCGVLEWQCTCIKVDKSSNEIQKEIRRWDDD